MCILSVCQHLRVHFSEAHRGECITSKPPDEMCKIAKSSPQTDDLILQFLQELRLARQDCIGPWVLGVDFNLIYQAEDKNNSNLDRAMMCHFRHFINEVELQEIPLIGRKLTWSNERESPTLVRLDRVFATKDWDQLFPASYKARHQRCQIIVLSC
jgi:hypothetical protein